MTEPQRMTIGSPDAVSALVYEPAGVAAATVILAHGAGTHQRHRGLVAIADGLAARAVRAVTFNFPYTERGRRTPDRPPVLEQTWRDVVIAVGQRVPEGPLVVGGRSMGGRIASQVLARRPDGPAWRRVAGLVLLGYPLHPPGRPEQPRTAHLPAVDVPILLVQGTKDAFGARDEVEPVFTALSVPLTCEWIEGGDHSFNVPKSRGRTPEAILDRLCGVIAEWAARLTTGG